MMQSTRNSWIFAALTLISIILYVKKAAIWSSGVTGTLFFATILFGILGFVMGLGAVRKEGSSLKNWLAPGVNALLIVLFIAYFGMIMYALERMN